MLVYVVNKLSERRRNQDSENSLKQNIKEIYILEQKLENNRARSSLTPTGDYSCGLRS